MTVTLSRISDLPHALRDGQQFARRLDGHQPAVFLDYDGTLTPIVSLYLGDDITDEDAFRALKGSSDRPGIGVVVADPDEPEQARRTTAADFVLWSMGEVQQFLNTLAR